MDDTRPGSAPDDASADPVADAVLDGNAVGGMLGTLFAAEMTAVPGKCAHCGTMSAIGSLRAYVRAPGTVLRCPACGGVVIRVVETAEATYVDARGAAYLRFGRG